jgi:phage-related protein
MIDLIEQHGAQLGPPHTANLGNGLFEMRIKAKEGIGRAFFCYMVKQEIVILHTIIKKSQKTPARDLAIARIRMKELMK